MSVPSINHQPAQTNLSSSTTNTHSKRKQQHKNSSPNAGQNASDSYIPSSPDNSQYATYTRF